MHSKFCSMINVARPDDVFYIRGDATTKSVKVCHRWAHNLLSYPTAADSLSPMISRVLNEVKQNCLDYLESTHPEVRELAYEQMNRMQQTLFTKQPVLTYDMDQMEDVVLAFRRAQFSENWSSSFAALVKILRPGAPVDTITVSSWSTFAHHDYVREHVRRMLAEEYSGKKCRTLRLIETAARRIGLDGARIAEAMRWYYFKGKMHDNVEEMLRKSNWKGIRSQLARDRSELKSIFPLAMETERQLLELLIDTHSKRWFTWPYGRTAYLGWQCTTTFHQDHLFAVEDRFSCSYPRWIYNAGFDIINAFEDASANSITPTGMSECRELQRVQARAHRLKCLYTNIIGGGRTVGCLWVEPQGDLNELIAKLTLITAAGLARSGEKNLEGRNGLELRIRTGEGEASKPITPNKGILIGYGHEDSHDLLPPVEPLLRRHEFQQELNIRVLHPIPRFGPWHVVQWMTDRLTRGFYCVAGMRFIA